ncbi:MAG: bifunctional hydroxymethylpyrimidine kinase/phosphomethylpyrimidine kinase [Caldisericia bacterium]|nr:bifunctional hydroxymethylpyrimidine kinase/phosphomethylpyrimidine kinase [Caldisericia bacterium]
MIVKAMIVAGSDSCAGAGVQADLKTFSAFGVYATTALTLLTAQNTLGITETLNVDPLMVSSQIHAIMTDIGAHAIKIGVIPTVDCATEVAKALLIHKAKNIVLDTVLVSTSGHTFGGDAVTKAMVDLLFPIASLVTPNISETAILSGTSIKSLEDLKRSIKIIHDLGAKMIVSTGWIENNSIMDVFYNGKHFHTFESPLIDGVRVHGAGCTFSSAIAASLALGLGMKESISKAKEYVTRAIKSSLEIGKGLRTLNHFSWRPNEH